MFVTDKQSKDILKYGEKISKFITLIVKTSGHCYDVSCCDTHHFECLISYLEILIIRILVSKWNTGSHKHDLRKLN